MTDREIIYVALRDAMARQFDIISAFKNSPDSDEYKDAVSLRRRYHKVIQKRYQRDIVASSSDGGEEE